MRKPGTFLLVVCMALATVSAPTLAQNGHMMGDDHGQGMMGDDHGQGMMGNDDHGQGMMGNDRGQGMMGDDDHGQGMMGDDDHGQMGNGHGMSDHDGQ